MQVAGLKRDMQIDCDMAKSRVDLLRKQVDNLMAANANDPRLRPLIETQRKQEQEKAMLDALNIRLRQVTADIAQLASPVRIVSHAEAPSHPLKPNVPIDLLLFTVAGLLLGIVTASFVELLLWLRC